jgi:hypothetical protein
LNCRFCSKWIIVPLLLARVIVPKLKFGNVLPYRKIVRLARYDSYNKTILLGTAAICVKNKTVVDAEMTVPEQV